MTTLPPIDVETPIDRAPVRIGALAPLSPPGWVEAGRHLIAGMELAVTEINASGGVAGSPLELLVRDTAADPARAEAAVDELDALGVTALAGEYHSVVARAVAAHADARRLPFLCSSAVLDTLTDQPTDWVARLAPPQSRGWRLYADFLAAAGHETVAIVSQPSVYWAAGAAILRDALTPRGVAVIEFDMRAFNPASLCDALAEARATAALILLGHPEPALPVASALRADPRLVGLMIGAPAGQPEFAAWAAMPGGAGIPFLRYLPERLGPLGQRVGAALAKALGEAPSFVAFEGYDAIAVLADAMRAHGADRDRIAAAWSSLATEATRGTIRFTRVEGITVWQWAGPPIEIVARDPEDPARVRVLYAG